MRSENNDYDNMGSLGPNRVGFSVPPGEVGEKSKIGKILPSILSGYLV